MNSATFENISPGKIAGKRGYDEDCHSELYAILDSDSDLYVILGRTRSVNIK